jgi:hypothetical protein
MWFLLTCCLLAQGFTLANQVPTTWATPPIQNDQMIGKGVCTGACSLGTLLLEIVKENLRWIKLSNVYSTKKKFLDPCSIVSQSCFKCPCYHMCSLYSQSKGSDTRNKLMDFSWHLPFMEMVWWVGSQWLTEAWLKLDWRLTEDWLRFSNLLQVSILLS